MQIDRIYWEPRDARGEDGGSAAAALPEAKVLPAAVTCFEKLCKNYAIDLKGLDCVYFSELKQNLRSGDVRIVTLRIYIVRKLIPIFREKFLYHIVANLWPDHFTNGPQCTRTRRGAPVAARFRRANGAPVAL